jgi:long-chain acyl-CoA synthetase
MAQHRVTVFGGGPPAIYAGLLSASNLPSANLDALRVCPAGGAPFAFELMERWRAATGCTISEGYGMTEISPIAGTNALTGRRKGAVGKAVPDVLIQVVDLKFSARILPAGDVGEIRVRGPQMMKAYLDDPEETAAAIRQGWMLTGDIGYIDTDGFLFITGRKKDVVFVKGFNVYPREVEEALMAHPKLAAAAVMGAPDPQTGGEQVIAFVVACRGESVDQEELAAHCAAQLVAYSRPTAFKIVESLPMTPTNKLDRIALRKMFTVTEAP